MNEILDSLQKCKDWKQQMRESCRKNNVTTTFANDLTIIKLRSLYQRFKKNYDSVNAKNGDFWIENQLRAYHWTLIAITTLQKIPIKHFSAQIWLSLSKVFGNKSQVFLKFQARRLLSQKNRTDRNWNKEQENIFVSLVSKAIGKYQNQINQIKWNQIAHELFQRSQQNFFRTGKQCRQRWLNHHDPRKKHGQWTEEEDQLILRIVQKQGKKWSKIVKELNDTRTQHMVKNRFNSLNIKRKRTTNFNKKQIKSLMLIQEKGQPNPSEAKQQHEHQEMRQIKQKIFRNQDEMSRVDFELEVGQKSKIQKKDSVQNQSLSAFSMMGLDHNMYHLIREDPDIGNRTELQQVFTPTYTPTYMFSPTVTPPLTYFPSPSPTGFVFSSSILFQNNNAPPSFQNSMNIFLQPKNQ